MPGIRGSLLLLLVAAAACLLAGPSEGAPQSTSSLPCGVATVIDRLLCTDGNPPGAGPAEAAAPDDPSEHVVLSSTTPRIDPGRLLVRFKRGTRPQTAAAVVSDAGAEIERTIEQIRLHVVRVEPARREQALHKLQASPAVEEAGHEIVVESFETVPNDSDFPEQWGLRVAGFTRAWDISRGSARIVVAVVDTGVDANHPDLEGAVVPGYDFVNRDADTSDDNGHGTAVAGIIAARANNGQGIAGVCWTCRVLPVKVLDAAGTGTTAVVAEGIIWAADHGAHVINASLGAPEATTALTDAVSYAVKKGAIVVAAAGNSGSADPFYPASDPGALGVAATDAGDRFYPWSSFGSWVRVAAPGCSFAPTLGGAYGVFCGTSAAAPIVAGLGALALAGNPSATGAQVRQAIEQASLPLGARVASGRVDAAATLTALRAAPAANAPANETATFRGTVTPSASLRAYRRVVGAGLFEATLAFEGARRLTLALTSPAGTPIVRVSGRSPLHFRRELPAGKVLVVVDGRGARASFVLAVEHVFQARGPVEVSSIPEGPPAGELPATPQLVRAEGVPGPVAALDVRVTRQRELARSIAATINAVRRSHGLRALAVSGALTRAAEAHGSALAVAGDFTHAWPDGRPFERWILGFYPARGFGFWTAGENLLWSAGALSPRAAVELWLASPSHRRIVLGGSWRQLGIGAVLAESASGVYGGNTVYVVAAEFGARRAS